MPAGSGQAGHRDGVAAGCPCRGRAGGGVLDATQTAGSTPSVRAASRYGSGCGLVRCTSSPVHGDRKVLPADRVEHRRRPRTRSDIVTSARGTPAALVSSSSSRAPGMPVHRTLAQPGHHAAQQPCRRTSPWEIGPGTLPTMCSRVRSSGLPTSASWSCRAPGPADARDQAGLDRRTRPARCRRASVHVEQDGGGQTAHLALKYVASGWCSTSASVDCSGCSWNSSESFTPMRSGSSSSTSLARSSRSGQAP